MNPQLFSAQMGNPAMSRLYQEFKPSNNESANFQMPPAMLYQTMLLRAKAMKLMQVRNMQIQNQQTNLSMNSVDCVGHLKQEPSHVEGIFPKISEEQNFKEESASIKMESLSRGSEPSLKSESTAALPTTPIEKPTVVAEVAKPVDSAGLDIYLKTEIEKIVTFLLTNMGKSSQAEIDGVRQLYIQNPCLLQIFDKLVMKYYSAKKCKEDIVRYILRRAFKIMRTSIMKREKVCSKKASLILCKKYFQSNFDEIQASGVNVENDDQLLELFMPYRKNSKIKTMNTTFVLEIFGSDDFCKEYQSFLNNFSNILNVDNNKKKDKLLQFLMECIKKNNFSKIGSYSRLPWLDVWMEDTKNIAEGLMPNKKLITNYKKTKH